MAESEQEMPTEQVLGILGIGAFLFVCVVLAFVISAREGEPTRTRITSHVMACPSAVLGCDVGADREAAMVIMARERRDLAAAVEFVEGHRIDDLRMDLRLAGRLVSLPHGTAVTELRRSPPNVTGKPRFSVVRIEEGKYAGATVWAVADQVAPRAR